MYVQAYGGSDAVGTGEKDSPVATISRALDIAKAKYNKSPDEYSNVQIVVGDGVYNEIVYMSSQNVGYGEKGLLIKAQNGAKPTVVGGVTYDISDATKVDDEAVLNRLHSDTAKQNLYVLDLTTKIDLNDIPAVDYPGSYNLNSMLLSTGLENPPKTTCEAIFDNNLMTVARYPNSGYALAGEIVDGGIEGRHMLSSYDGTEYDLEVSQENLLKGFEIKSDYENLAKWATADQALIFGYFMFDWATQTVPLKGVNAENGSLRSKYPSYYGIKEGKRYYVYNLLEEIDMPGEYFIDRKTGKMYFYMPDDATNTSTISITTNTWPLLSIGSGAKNITVDGLCFSGSKLVAINIAGNNNIIKNCEIGSVAAEGINVNGKNNVIDNCYIHDVNVGVFLSGGESATLTPGNNKVQNCEITRFSRKFKTYAPAIDIYGVGNLATHNEIHDGEHTALRYSGQNHELSYNEVYNVCKETDDTGAVYVGGTWINRGNKILFNYFHDIRPSVVSNDTVAGIFCDNHYAGAYIEGNVFANITGHGVRGLGGRDHTVTNNVFVNCSKGGTYMRDLYDNEKKFSHHISELDKVPYTSELWTRNFPKLAALGDIVNDSKKTDSEKIEALAITAGHIYTKNLSVNCGENGLTGYFYGSLATEYAEDISNNYVTDIDPGFTDMENGNYTINSETLAGKINKFKTIEFDKIGRQ
ncbi:MAG: right-handed parallel beta-helix repeat-containing protein [Clostridia bacterium]|nr:right-handed parallel beta-helix repeat-containing protein [Clostridia bacterium]